MGNFNKNLMKDQPGGGSYNPDEKKKGVNLKLVAIGAIVVILALIIVPVLMEVA